MNYYAVLYYSMPLNIYAIFSVNFINYDIIHKNEYDGKQEISLIIKVKSGNLMRVIKLILF